jgi:flagellar hook-associated protein 2
MAMSIDGLVSGMNTTTTISQLMQLEALPQTALKNKVTAQTKAVTAYQSINTKLAALTTAAKALGTADTWGAMKATSSSDAAIVTTKPGAAAGSLSFTVDALAAAHTVTFKAGYVGSRTDAVNAPVMSGTTFLVRLADNTEVTVTPDDASLQKVVDKINETPNAAYKAAAVQIGPGKYTLQLTAIGTGVDNVFADAGADAPAGINLLGAATITTQGSDAKLTIGDPLIGYEVTSASNTFADIMPGITVTAAKKQTDTPITVSLAADKDGLADKVQAMVDAANAALKEIRTQTAAKVGTTAAGALVGDSALRQLSQEILSAVASGAGALGTLSAVGIKLERGGTLTFDRKVFTDAYAADPALAQTLFDSYDNVAHANAKPTGFDPGWDTANGLARKLETIGLRATEGLILPTDLPTAPREGTLPGMIKRRTESITSLNDQVASWDIRLASRQKNLQRQYASLEVALGKLQSQSSWLSGQLASL